MARIHVSCVKKAYLTIMLICNSNRHCISMCSMISAYKKMQMGMFENSILGRIRYV